MAASQQLVYTHHHKSHWWCQVIVYSPSWGARAGFPANIDIFVYMQVSTPNNVASSNLNHTLVWSMRFYSIHQHNHGYACDRAWCVQFKRQNCTVVLHLSCTNGSATDHDKSTSIYSKASVDSINKFSQSLLRALSIRNMMFQPKVTKLSNGNGHLARLLLELSVTCDMEERGLAQWRHREGWYWKPKHWSNVSLWAFVIYIYHITVWIYRGHNLALDTPALTLHHLCAAEGVKVKSLSCTKTSIVYSVA